MTREYAFFIVGLPEAGKALTANLLSHYLRVPQAASSSIVYDELAKRRGCQRWELEACPKVQIVAELERVGNDLCGVDPAALVAPLLQRGVRVIHGIRRRLELGAARASALAQGLEPVVVWLDRHTVAQDNTEITREDADFVVKNHGSVGQLTNLVFDLASEFIVARPEPDQKSILDMHRIDSSYPPGESDIGPVEEKEEGEDDMMAPGLGG